MNSLKVFSVWFLATFRPAAWLRSGTTNRSWDKKLLNSIKEGDVRVIDRYRAVCGGISVWVANYPYGSGTVHSRCEFKKGEICSRYTDSLLHAIVEEELKR